MDENTEDCEVLACVELQKPPNIPNDSSFILFTMNGTASGKI